MIRDQIFTNSLVIPDGNYGAIGICRHQTDSVINQFIKNGSDVELGNMAIRKARRGFGTRVQISLGLY